MREAPGRPEPKGKKYKNVKDLFRKLIVKKYKSLVFSEKIFVFIVFTLFMKASLLYSIPIIGVEECPGRGQGLTPGIIRPYY